MLAARWIEVPPVLSLEVILGLLAITVGASLWPSAKQKS
jgi:hypothetical protein